MTDAEPDLPGFGGEEGGPDSQTMHFMTTSLLKHDQGSKMPFHYVHPHSCAILHPHFVC